LREQSVDLGENDRQGSPPIAISEILFGTEGTVVWAAPRRLNLCARPPGWDIKAMVVMMMAADHLV
jgi:hypothetical protein